MLLGFHTQIASFPFHHEKCCVLLCPYDLVLPARGSGTIVLDVQSRNWVDTFNVLHEQGVVVPHGPLPSRLTLFNQLGRCVTIKKGDPVVGLRLSYDQIVDLRTTESARRRMEDRVLTTIPPVVAERIRSFLKN